jgi:hypothetical protein
LDDGAQLSGIDAPKAKSRSGEAHFEMLDGTPSAAIAMICFTLADKAPPPC